MTNTNAAPIPFSGAGSPRWTVDPAPPDAALALAAEAFDEFGLGPYEDGYAALAVTAAGHLDEVFPKRSSILDWIEDEPVPVVPAELRPPREHADGGRGAFRALCDREPQLYAAYCTAAHVGPGVEAFGRVVCPYDADDAVGELIPAADRAVAGMLAHWVGDLVGPGSRWDRHPILGHPKVYDFVMAVVTEAYLVGRVVF